MASTLLGFPGIRWVDANGKPLNGGLIYTYAQGTSTAKASYPTKADADAGTNALSNPVVLDSGGQKQIWLDGTYKIIVKNAQGVTVQTVDEVGDASDENELPKNYIAGLTLSSAADADHDITVAIGEARDAADTADMALAAAITKQIDAAWAVGSDAGGLDTGTVANATLYAVWLIKRTDTGVVDALFSTSFTAPTMPTNYDVKRLIGCVRTDGSANILAFRQVGDLFLYAGAISDLNDATITDDTFETATINAPPNSIAHMFVSASNGTAVAEVSVTLRRVGSTVGSSMIAAHAGATLNAGSLNKVVAQASVLLDSSRQLQYAAAEASGTVTVQIETFGFTMLTRREP